MSIGLDIIQKLQRPAHIPDTYTLSQLIKICKTEEYINDFISGKFYMNTFGFFSDYEHKLTDGQHDELDGTEEYLRQNEDNFKSRPLSFPKIGVNYCKNRNK